MSTMPSQLISPRMHAVPVGVGVLVGVAVGVLVAVAVAVGVGVGTWSVKVTTLMSFPTLKLAVPAAGLVVTPVAPVMLMAPTCWPAGMVSWTLTAVPTGRNT